LPARAARGALMIQQQLQILAKLMHKRDFMVSLAWMTINYI
jgi:hypothetical protein